MKTQKWEGPHEDDMTFGTVSSKVMRLVRVEGISFKIETYHAEKNLIDERSSPGKHYE